VRLGPVEIGIAAACGCAEIQVAAPLCIANRFRQSLSPLPPGEHATLVKAHGERKGLGLPGLGKNRALGVPGQIQQGW
jgi:hypothetical protein